MSEPIPPAATSDDSRTAELLIAFAAHAVLDAAMFGRAWVVGYSAMLAMLAVLLAQCSLVAIWAARGRSPRSMRFLLAPLLIMVCWMLVAKLLSWSVGSSTPFEWAVTMIVQTVSIIVVLAIARRAWSFDLQSLVYTMVAAAMVFAFFRVAQSYWIWAIDPLDPMNLAIQTAVGLLDALVAIACLFLIAKPVSRANNLSFIKKLSPWLVVIFAVVLASSLLNVFVEIVYGNSGFAITDSLVLFGVQAACVGVTVGGVTRSRPRIG